MSHAKRRADRIRAAIPITQVLHDYGYRVNPDGGDREQQYSCDLHGDGRDNTPSARVYPATNSCYCVSVQERVLTSFGWVKLGDLPDLWLHLGITALTYDGSSWQHPTAYLPRGNREVVRVQTKAGYAITVTPDHEIEVRERGWIPVKDLQPGDEVTVPKLVSLSFPANVPGSLKWLTGPLNQVSYKGYPNLCLPSDWSFDLGEALGYVFGNGCVVSRKAPSSGVVAITAHVDDADDVRKVFHHMQRWASGRGSEVLRTDVVRFYGKAYPQNQVVFSIRNDGFCEFFQRLGVHKEAPADQRRLPDGIWQAPKCGIQGFLRGIYGADGSVFRPSGRKGLNINLYSVSSPFLQDVQLVLLQFGIHSRLYPPSKTRVESGKRKGKHTHPCWYLQLATGKDILTFREHIGIANARKQALLDSYDYNPRGARPFRAVIESVTPVREMEVADISMSAEPSFIAGGIKVHNCFACDKSRDAIQVAREKEGLDFWGAVKALEARYDLSPLPWEDEDYSEKPKTVSEEVREALDPSRTFEEEAVRTERFLQMLTDDHDTPMGLMLSMWEAFDAVVWSVNEGGWKDRRGKEALAKIREKLKS